MSCSAVRGSVAHPDAERVVNRVGDRGRRWALRALADSQGRIAFRRNEFDVDCGHLGEPQDGVGLPGVAGDIQSVEPHPLFERPTGGLDRTALDLIGRTVGVDDQSRIHRDDEPSHPHLVDRLDLGHDRAVGG